MRAQTAAARSCLVALAVVAVLVSCAAAVPHSHRDHNRGGHRTDPHDTHGRVGLGAKLKQGSHRTGAGIEAEKTGAQARRLPRASVVSLVTIPPRAPAEPAEFVPDLEEIGSNLKARASGSTMERLMVGYNKEDRPGMGGDPVTVHVGATIEQLSLDESSSTVDVTFVLRSLWVDPRLAYNHTGSHDGDVGLLHWPNDRLWTAPVEMVNQYRTSTTDSFTLSYNDGRVYRSTRHITRAFSKFDVGWFPFDKQNVMLVFEAGGGLTAADLQLTNWAQKTRLRSEYVLYFKDMNPQITISSVAGQTLDGRVVVEMHTVRQFAPLINKAVIPIFFINLVSYLTLYMDPPTVDNPHTVPRPSAVTVMFLTMLTYCKMVVHRFIPPSASWTLFDGYIMVQQLFNMACVLTLVAHYITVRLLILHGSAPEKIAKAMKGLRVMDNVLIKVIPLVYVLASLAFLGVAFYLIFN